MLYSCVNGFTKEKMKEYIRKGNNNEKSTSECFDGRSYCSYLSYNGNKCAIGCFIPDGHQVQKEFMDVRQVLRTYPELQEYMPFDDSDILNDFQMIHDNSYPGKVRENLFKWIDENVED